MGPEVLLATAAGTALVIAASLFAGWTVRSKIASVVEERLDAQLARLDATLARERDDAQRARDASVGVLAAADRRAGHDSDADPLGLGLLLPGGLLDEPNAASREADEDNDGAIGKGTL